MKMECLVHGRVGEGCGYRRRQRYKYCDVTLTRVTGDGDECGGLVVMINARATHVFGHEFKQT